MPGLLDSLIENRLDDMKCKEMGRIDRLAKPIHGVVFRFRKDKKIVPAKPGGQSIRFRGLPA